MHLSEVRQALRHVFRQLLGRPAQDLECLEMEFGEVLLYVIRLANRLGIDVVASAGRRNSEGNVPSPGSEAHVRPSVAVVIPLPVQPPRILIVDDERIVAADLQETLNGLGYDAYAIASSGAKALAIACEQCPDIALMDIRIQGSMDGIEVATQLRRKFNTAVIFITALTDDKTVQRATHADPYAYLVKPVSSFSLRTTVELTDHRRRRAP